MMNYNFGSIEVMVDLMKSGELVYKDGKMYRNERELRLQKTGKGSYMSVQVKVNGVKHRGMLHRLLFAYAYGVDELKQHETIDHINGDKYDNRIENLQGLSVFENSQKDSNGKLSIKDAIEIKKLLAEGLTNVEIAKRYSVSNVTISKIRRGVRFRNV